MPEISILNKRIIQARRHEWKIGILIGVGMLAFASAIILYTIRVVIPKQEKIEQQAYRDSTRQLSERLVTGVENLSEWSTDESLESYSKAIVFLADRNNVDPSLDEELNKRVDTLKETRRTRQIRFEVLMDVVDDFQLVSTVDAVLAFDRRMRKATSTLSRKQGDDLMQKWSARRLNVVAIRKANR
ncbi:MAG: hypothetical protein P8L49_10815 [Opitutaceae bacterium]|nr:hypothetical protein [Opitutaceae bacterium]